MTAALFDTLGAMLTADEPRCFECGCPVPADSAIGKPCNDCNLRFIRNLRFEQHIVVNDAAWS